MMKALTLKQPWAWAVAYVGKDVENRTWRTTHRGLIAIHAGGRSDREAILPNRIRHPRAGELVFSAVVAVAEITDVVDHSRSKWFFGPYGFVLLNVVRLPTAVPCPGWLGLWTLPVDVEKRVKLQ